MIKKFLLLISALFLLALNPFSAFALDDNQDDTTVGTINLGGAQGEFGINPTDTGVNTLISNAITIVFIVAAVLVLIMLIWGGIEWVLSGGDKEKVANARKRIISALIGMAIIALAFFIVSIVGGIFGFNVLKDLKIPTLDAPVKGE